MTTIKIVTHDGGFHADDVFGVATLLILLGEENVSVTRTRDRSIIEQGDYVLDVGDVYEPEQNRFDHHQGGGAGKRENGIPYASFGLIWKKFGAKLCGNEKIARSIENNVVIPIDAFDNGMHVYKSVFQDIAPYLVQNVFFALEPAWEEKGWTIEEGFNEALMLAKKILRREIIRAQQEEKALKVMQAIYERAEDKRIVVCDDGRLWSRTLLYKYFERLPEVMYFVRRHENGTWQVAGTVDDHRGFVVRKPFPEAWGGKRGEELAHITGVVDALFCHRGLFMVVARSKEGALQLAQAALAS